MTEQHTQTPPQESWFPRSAYIPVCTEKRNPRSIDTQACRTDKPQSETARPSNTRDNQMAKGKCKIITNRNQGNMAPLEPSTPTTANPGYPNTPEKQELDLKSHFMMLIEDFKKDINNPRNTGKHGSTGRSP